ncbi:hypothetical protein PPYR_14944 [Photinus pyralis]|uniref:Uncharacterized protein n=1 Tax=Photinus pyralis TaxID=7054 RepID=A0A1Y1NLL5_PHOPY|nr:uncharacterized protein LOC116181755 [Photinus pyralis]XP_031358036.1 uncharacterized protein LOC116181755 [Photinus pyralis]KAB0790857.1 hypothetical protein PPYR_14944 [Photinus pyralis]
MSRSYLHQENSVRYLYSLLNTLPAPAKSTLESFYLSRCCDISKRELMKLPDVSNSRVRCPHCFIEYDCRGKSCELAKSRITRRFARKLVKKRETGKELTKYQKQYLRSIRNKTQFGFNTFTEICSFCTNKRTTDIKKPAKKRAQPAPVPIRNKKRRKKDKFAGLDEVAVSSVQQKECAPKIVVAKNTAAFKPNSGSLKHKNRKLKNLLDGIKTESSLQQFLYSI